MILSDDRSNICLENEFHGSLMKLTGNKALITEHERLLNRRLFLSLHNKLLYTTKDQKMIDTHQHLLSQLTTEDPDLAEKAIRYHLGTSRIGLERMLKNTERGDTIDFDLSVSLVKAADRRPQFTKAIEEKLKNSWMVACIKKHLEIEPVIEFSKKPFSEWSGPPEFWEMVPSFILKLKARGMMPIIDDKIGPCQKFIINRYIKYFKTVKDMP